MSTITATAAARRQDKTAEPAAAPRFSLTKVQPCIGAEVADIDLRQALDDDTIAALRRALVDHKVLFFRDQDITPAQHVALARRFGELEIHPVFNQHPEHPELVLLGGSQEVKASENIYHADTTWRERPSMASMLRCVECPPQGGDTIWVNMVAAYEALPAAVKAHIAELKGVHDIRPSFAKRLSPEEARAKYPAQEHPVVRTHPESGEKILYVNDGFTTSFANYTSVTELRYGVDRRFGELDLLAYLLRQATIPEFQVRLKWRPNTIAFWDNRSTQHYAVQDYFPQVRRMMRATVVGDRPV